MCRHLGYLGPTVPISALLLDPPHSLLRQSYAPKDMRAGGTVNVDGFGFGWYPGNDEPPVRYRRATPIWADENLPALAAATRTGALLAAVRSGTGGMPVVDTACAPFTDGRWLFSHNGVIRGWPGSVRELAGALPVEDLLTLDAPTDSALLWALLRHRLRAGEAPADAVAAVVAAVAEAAPQSRLNLLLTDGAVLVGTAWTHALSVLRKENSVLVASEPVDSDEGWLPVPDGSLVLATPSTVDFRQIDDGRRGADRDHAPSAPRTGR
ncbi:ergothioneine biosynthesis protein EgtC [Solihabitans fulvus]|uniref:Gamma-glutamyl-hercynylcysteine sulfoxide hydrolase n=1 Tax=Solihabitans fulvus TaxID=1892852 RepID=A0A5B2WT12_9PSEU|nr:ergothioneine biosynthesis protein EgtC [Solihabitans fulvus]KAA2254098.1 ergothioneine biosynthesis protein EgtC [Solihabitans fulvus]